MKRILTACLLLAATAAHGQTLTQYVDPLIGSGGHGHVFVGADVPFGMVQLGPTSLPQQWDWCSGYHDSDSTVIGFSHTHLSGTGIGDLFDVTVMPVVGSVTYARGEAGRPESGLWSYAERSRQEVRPGYYKTFLTRYGITAELTASERVGLHRYTFPESDSAAIVIDLENGGCWDKTTQSYMEVAGGQIVMGYRYSTGWAKNQKIYFALACSKPMTSCRHIGDRYLRINFPTSEGEQVYVAVALSPTSMSAAVRNLEISDVGFGPDGFDKTVAQAQEKWERALSKIKIETQDERVRRIFYTALYHTMIAPVDFSDAAGTYLGPDGNLRYSDTGNYTILSLWDTYRAAHPLMTLIQHDRYTGIVQSMLNIYHDQGKLPVWHLMNNETDCMVGNPGVCVVADAVLKGVPGIDPEEAYEAMRQSVMLDERGLKEYRERGYIAIEDGTENVSRTLEYALADWAVAQVAKRLGKTDDYEYFSRRAQSYRNVFDPESHFMRGRHADGSWRTPFNPFFSAHEQDDNTEGNAWQYTWLVPHDVEGLAALFGGSKQMLAKLDSLFVVTGDLGADASPDISGLIGQYAHGNEPSHHTLYLYTMLGEPWKTADLVRRTLTELYTDLPDGLSGNEDVGQMSAWYVMSALGLYQVEPAGGRYVFGAPLVDRAELSVRGGTFTIEARNLSDTNRYVQRVLLNGRPLRQYWIDHADIERGGTLTFEMGSKKKKWY
ncbi:MAG: GH92 family glycosyl hydrolase [Bacteroidaceae bacterium]|nr:GH92 family glycosyl hydrolase [Bacteroidaceae bacterium]